MPDDRSPIRRRTLLAATGGALALPAVGSSAAGASDPDAGGEAALYSRRCPDATIRPSMGHCEGASQGGCADDHPETVALREAVAETLETTYPDAGALVDAGFKPYFDTLTDGDDGWSHWLSPEHVGSDRVLDPNRPESVLVDNDSWRSIGVMFVAVRDGEAVERPPPVYELEADAEWGDDHDETRDGDDGDTRDGGDVHDGDDGNHGSDADGHRCAPWHYHAGLPGRFAWWYYQQVYEGEGGVRHLSLPCRTPCVLHVWTVDHPESVYAHDAPPSEYRERPPAETAGFETTAEPGEDRLGWDVLPEDLVPDVLPEDVVPDVLPGELRTWFDR